MKNQKLIFTTILSCTLSLLFSQELEYVYVESCEELLDHIANSGNIIENEYIDFYTENTCPNLSINGVTFKHSQLKIRNNTGESLLNGISITNCKFYDYEDIALSIRGGHNNIFINDNYFYTTRPKHPDVHHDAIALTAEVAHDPYVGGNDGVVISNNTIDGSTNGFFITKCKKLLIENNYISFGGLLSGGIKIDNASGTKFDTITDILIQKNTFNSSTPSKTYASITLESEWEINRIENGVKEYFVLVDEYRPVDGEIIGITEEVHYETLTFDGNDFTTEYPIGSYIVQKTKYINEQVLDENGDQILIGVTKGVKIMNNWFNQPIKIHQALETHIEGNTFDMRGITRNAYTEASSFSKSGMKYIGNRFVGDDINSVPGAQTEALVFSKATDYTFTNNELGNMTIYDSKNQGRIVKGLKTEFIVGHGDITYGRVNWQIEIPDYTYKFRFSSHPEFAYYTDKIRTNNFFGNPMHFGGTTYVKVFAIKSDGVETQASQTIVIKRNNAPANLNSETVYNNSGALTTINWSEVTNASQYIAEYSTSEDFLPSTIINIPSNQTNVQIPSDFNTVTYARFKSIVDGVESEFSRVYSFYTKHDTPDSLNLIAQTNNLENTISLDNAIMMDDSNEINISPNPSSNFINIFIDDKINEPVSISISDFSGNMILEKESIGTNQIDISHLEKGIYFISISNGSDIIFEEKIIKI